MNAQCSVPWNRPNSNPKCCASDSTVGKMGASNPAASTPEGYLGGTAPWRTDLYTGRSTLVTLREGIEFNEKLGVKHTPELKSGDPERIKAIFGT